MTGQVRFTQVFHDPRNNGPGLRKPWVRAWQEKVRDGVWVGRNERFVTKEDAERKRSSTTDGEVV